MWDSLSLTLLLLSAIVTLSNWLSCFLSICVYVRVRQIGQILQASVWLTKCIKANVWANNLPQFKPFAQAVIAMTISLNVCPLSPNRTQNSAASPQIKSLYSNFPLALRTNATGSTAQRDNCCFRCLLPACCNRTVPQWFGDHSWKPERASALKCNPITQ